MDSVDKFGEFVFRHIGPSIEEIEEISKYLGFNSLDSFIDAAVPARIRTTRPLELKSFSEPLTEREALNRLKSSLSKNKVFRSFIGTGYYDSLTPTVIQRNILENPGWYTQYTPYQAEIAQGRLEALLNFQTVVTELTGLPIANASLLDEATAAAEAMALCLAVSDKSGAARGQFLVDANAHPQSIALLRTRGEALGVEILVADPDSFQFTEATFGAFVQSPNSSGEIIDYTALIKRAHLAKSLVVVASDLLALTLIKNPGTMGADVVVGSAQRFGVPLGFGGPHAAFFATRDEYKRNMPGRLVGVSRDSSGDPALRLSLQTREQHIRRERATSNICTAQVLLAVMASMYAVYHGPDGLRRIAERVQSLTARFVAALKGAGIKVINQTFFDTVVVEVDSEILQRGYHKGINLRAISANRVGVSFDELKTERDLNDLLALFGVQASDQRVSGIPAELKRDTPYLQQRVFNSYHSESEFLRYCRWLEAKDLSLCFSMIPLGSCTMKLNATSEMVPVTWPESGGIHPFAPRDQYAGYLELFADLEQALADLTGFAATSLQPNAGSQGEYAGLLVIRAYHQSRGDSKRNICLIPKSAHGTNPASAVMAGFTVVPVACDAEGNIDLQDLKTRTAEHAQNVACLMVTYPSTHGVFEENIKELTQIVHDVGGQVYLDGANLNALVGLVRPGEIGADVCHINLHKTFCIPHGGGGPGMGPICVAEHLAPFLPNHPLAELNHEAGIGPVSAAPWGSASILPISWMYIAMMGGEGLILATKVAILNANYVAKRLEGAFKTLYRGSNGFVAHECILDLRSFKERAGVEVDDVAKRLIDYGFHAPTVSWPVVSTMMVEPTESESRAELDRFCDAMLSIAEEIALVERGEIDRTNNPLKNAPHTASVVTGDSWDRPYTRKCAAFPNAWTIQRKFWPAVGRIDSAYGDKNLFCTCG